MNGDPWKNRSEGMRCRACEFFVPKELSQSECLQTMIEVEKSRKAPDPRGTIGRCRRHAPTTNGFPVVFEADWCGDHKLDESKI
jgi:hypothetical protein